MNLYDKYAKEFSNTRQNPWLGWKEVLLLIKENIHHQKWSTPIRVLDLGCGNGRFAKFLIENEVECEYIGIDKSAPLLGIAKNEVENPNFKFIQGDLENENWSGELPSGNFDLIVSFGLMHHISPFEKRKALLEKAFGILNSPGFFAVTYWQFAALERYKSKMTPTEQNKNTQYAENDYVLSFGKDATRFCHFINENELLELEKDLQFNESKKYITDGRENNENIYRIYFK